MFRNSAEISTPQSTQQSLRRTDNYLVRKLIYLTASVNEFVQMNYWKELIPLLKRSSVTGPYRKEKRNTNALSLLDESSGFHLGEKNIVGGISGCPAFVYI